MVRKTTPAPPRRAVNLPGDPYDLHEVQLAKRGPRAGDPKRVRADPAHQATEAQILNALEAREFAASKGWRLNTWLTVIFNQLHGSQGWVAGQPAETQVPLQRERLVRCLDAWCRRKGIPQSRILAVENVSGRGPHAHILMHLPETARLRVFLQEGEEPSEDPLWEEAHRQLSLLLRKFSGWTQRELDAAPPNRRPIDLSELQLPDDYRRDTVTRKMGYLLKSASPDAIVDYRGRRSALVELAPGAGSPSLTLQPSADTYSRRMVTSSQSIGSAARKAAGWRSGASLSQLSRKIAREEQIEEVQKLLKKIYRAGA